MSEQKSLLIELGTEELPVKALPGLAQAFFDGVITALEKRGVGFDRTDAKPLYTPRRLAVLLPGIDVEQPEQKSEVLGPYLSIALDADGPVSYTQLDVYKRQRLRNAGSDLGGAVKGFKKGMKDEDKPVGQLGDESRNETNSESKERDRDAH